MSLFSCTPCCGPVSVGWCLFGWGKSLAHYNFEGYYQTFPRNTSWTAAPLTFSTRYGASQTYYELGLNGYWMRMDLTVDFTQRARGKVGVTIQLRWRGTAGECGITVKYERSTSHWDNFDIPGRYEFGPAHVVSVATSGQTTTYPPQGVDVGTVGIIVGYQLLTKTGRSLLVNMQASAQDIQLPNLAGSPSNTATWRGMQAMTWQLDNLTTSGQKLCDVQKSQPWCVRSIERISGTLRGYGAVLANGTDPCSLAQYGCYSYAGSYKLWPEVYVSDEAYTYLAVNGTLDTGWLPSRLGPRPYPGFSVTVAGIGESVPVGTVTTQGDFRMTYKLV